MDERKYPEYCCDTFAWMVKEQSRFARGPSIRLTRGETGPTCLYVLNLADKGADIRALVARGDIATTCSQGIRFCPWCGTDIRKFYAESKVLDESPPREIPSPPSILDRMKSMTVTMLALVTIGLIALVWALLRTP